MPAEPRPWAALVAEGALFKKLLIGCLVVTGLLVGAAVLAVAFGGWAVSHYVSELTGDESSTPGRELARLRSAHPFAAPADGRFTEAQLTRFLGVCRRFAQFREKNVSRFREMSEGLQKSDDRVGAVLFFLRFGGQMRDEFVAAVGAEKMSFEEYRFLHAAVTRAALAGLGEQARRELERAGSRATEVGDLLHDLPDPVLREAAGAVRDVPAANLELVRPHAVELERLLPVAPMAGMLFPLLAGEDYSPYW